MSIYDQIHHRIGTGDLFDLMPVMGLATRRIVISKEIAALLNGPWHDKDWASRCNYLRADLERFITGGHITVAAKPYKGKSSYMLRLAPESEEVWEVRSRDPEPGIRVFGRFAAADFFVALTWAKRADLGGPHSRQWRDARIQCKTDWLNLLRPYEPFQGPHIHDYISTNAVSL